VKEIATHDDEPQPALRGPVLQGPVRKPPVPEAPALKDPLRKAPVLTDSEPARTPQPPVDMRPAPDPERIDIALRPMTPAHPPSTPAIPVHETVAALFDDPPPGIERLVAQPPRAFETDFSVQEPELPHFALAPAVRLIPEPASALLLGAALAAFVAIRRSSRSR
jgi:hypothetical protein